MPLKYSLFAIALWCLSMSACKNRDDPSLETPYANWVFNGSNYSGVALEKMDGSVHFKQNDTLGVWAVFNRLPTLSISEYKVVKGPAATLANNEMVLKIQLRPDQIWYSTGEETQTTSVKRTGTGSIVIRSPSYRLQLYENGVPVADTATGSCVLVYK